MDKVQWYYVIVYVFVTGAALWTHGKPMEGEYDFRYRFGTMLVWLPVTGRIFGWW